MTGDPSSSWLDLPAHPPLPPAYVYPRAGWDLLGRLSDIADYTWPVVTTLASLLPRRVGRLIRPESSPTTEADPIA